MEKNNRWKYVVGIILWVLLMGYITAQSVYYYAWYGDPDSTLTHVYDEDTGQFSYYWQEPPTTASYLNALQEMWFVPTVAILIAVAYGVFMHLTIKQRDAEKLPIAKAKRRIKIGNIVAVAMSLVWAGMAYIQNIAMYIVRTR